MIRISTRPAAGRLSLLTFLRRAHFRGAMIAVLLAGLSVFVVGMATLRIYMVDNMALAARAIAYTVEAAVVFDDRQAAGEALALMAANNPIAEACVLDRSGADFAHWKREDRHLVGALEERLAALLLDEPAVAEVGRDGGRIGVVKVYGSGREVLNFLVVSLLCGLLCLALSAAVAYRLSYRACRSIVEPLQRLAGNVSGARRERHFKCRLEPSAIAELQDLGNDVNALLEELERWQAQVKTESESLEHLANHDPLTGLANRARFESRLTDALASARLNDTRVAVFFIDGDRFKSINDAYGHEAGDAVLRAIARRLKAQVRASDLVARLGGDEFAVLLAPLREVEHAHRIAGNMLSSMQGEIGLPDGSRLATSLSIGIAFYPEHAGDAAGLLKQADAAMYRAKRARRASYHVARNDEIDQLPGESP